MSLLRKIKVLFLKMLRVHNVFPFAQTVAILSARVNWLATIAALSFPPWGAQKQLVASNMKTWNGCGVLAKP